MKPSADDVVRQALREDLTTFVRRTFTELHPQAEYHHNWHLDLMANRLMAVADGRIRRLIITVPPRSLKSITVSVAFVAWALGRNPRRRFICASYGQELAEKHARDTRQVMQAPWYQQTFPTRIAKERAAASDFQTTEQGGRMATSVGGVLTGRGGDILIIDDPVKPDEAMSKVQREAANHWFDQTLYSRLNDKRTGAIVIVMQRLHLDDLVGHVLPKEDWEVVNLPALAVENEEWRYRTIRGPAVKVRREGQALHAEREPVEVLAALRENLGEYAFSAQYQQSPVPQGGGLVKVEWLHYYEPGDLPASFDNVIQSWDTANKATELSDYSVCTTWGLKGKKIYLLNVFRKRLNYPDLKRAVQEQAGLFGAKTILIEDKASGTQLIQELQQAGLYGLHGVKPEGDKVMRMNAQTAQFENGLVLLPVRAPWLVEFVHELTSFPTCRFDDQVDSTSQGLAWIVELGREPPFLIYIRQEVERMQREKG